MLPSEMTRAIAAARSIATSRGLAVDDAIVLHNSNKLSVRLLPCDVLVRVAPQAQQGAQFEIDLAQRLIGAGCPVRALEPRVEPRVHQLDGFVFTFWTYHERVTEEIAPADYALALRRLHAGMRTVDVPTPHFTDRVEEARQLVADRARSPELRGPDRDLLGETLSGLGSAIGDRGGDQLLHGEPHPGNLLATEHGPLFIDLETACRGPIEFDLAHAPDDVAEHYPDIDPVVLRQCRLLMLAMITAWRWDRADQFPDGRRLGEEWLDQLRVALAGDALG
jgi:hypothetical protein